MAVVWVVDLGSLRLIRKQKRIKQIDLAKSIGMLPSNYSHIETGKINMALKTLCKISSALDISPARLLHPVYGKQIKDYEDEWRDPFF